MTAFAESVVTAGDLEIAYLHAGSPSGPLAVCLHGFPDTPWTWRHLAGELAQAGWRVVAPFLRGYAPTIARTGAEAGQHALGHDANRLHASLDGDSRAVLIGHDWGAAAAYAASAADPARWSKVVAASWPPWPADLDLASFDQMRRSWYVFLFQLPRAEQLVRDEAFLRRLWASWSPGYEADRDVAAAAAALNGPGGSTLALEHYRALFSSEGSDPVLPPCPTLYVHGGKDGCIGSELIGGLDEHLAPGSRVFRLEEVGHFPQLEAPAAFNAAVLEFLREAHAPSTVG